MFFEKDVVRKLKTGALLLLPLSLLACKTTESTVKQDYSNGINVAVAASGSNPAYHITDTVGAAGSGFAYMLEKRHGHWRMMYDSFDAKAFDKRLVADPEAVRRLRTFRNKLEALQPFDEATTEQCLKEFVEAEGIKFNQIIHALRVATTGKPAGFGMFETLTILGRERSLARIDRALARVESLSAQP